MIRHASMLPGYRRAVLREAYPDLYAAVGVHVSPVDRPTTSAFNAMRGLENNANSRAPTVVKPTIVFHGDMDETVHPCNGAKVIARVSRRPICGPRPKGRSRPKGKASPILCIATRPGSAYLNYGNPPARATLGPAAVWQDHSPAKMVRTRHARCRASSFNIDFQNREH